MNLTREQEIELAQFPAALKALVEAELAAGNTFEEIGHSHPAPPVGAYIKLANKVSTRPRASGDGLDFYERNSPIYSGEFTDAKRFFFVLEPPDPPPPEPDMDAIRKACEPKPEALTQLAQRETASYVEIALGDGSSRDDETRARKRSKAPAAPRRPLTFTESATRLHHQLHFRDKRPPHLVQFALERELMVLFTAAMEGERLQFRACANVNGANYEFVLRFVAALPRDNCYLLCTDVSWADQPPTCHDHFRPTANSWLELWTRDLMPATPASVREGSRERYRQYCDATLQAERHLDSAAAVQRAIVAGMKHGGSFGTSHKEGGTSIYWHDGKFIRSDYGDYPDLREFTEEADFLNMLRQFCRFDVRRNTSREPLTELNEWKLILRRMSARRAAASG